MPQPFADLPSTPATHFQLLFFGAVREVIERVKTAAGSERAALERFPFLAGYAKQIDGCRVEHWRRAVEEWERAAPAPLPIATLAAAGELDRDALDMLFLCGLPEEDARFGAIFAELDGVPERPWPSLGLLTSWWLASQRTSAARITARRLLALGIVAAANPEAPRPRWALQPSTSVWDAMRGESLPLLPAGIEHHLDAELPMLSALVWEPAVEKEIERAADFVSRGAVVVIRGARSNGRHTLAGALARAARRGILLVKNVNEPATGPLATLLGAMPVLTPDPPPRQTVELPPLRGYRGPACIILGREGGVSGELLDRSMTIELPLPGHESRRALWNRLSPAADGAALADALRCSSGMLVQVAGLAALAAADEREPTVEDVRRAAQSLARQHLDRLAEYVEPVGTPLAVAEETRRELAYLESRCRHRERLENAGVGVRALLRGPSGTGKTLAAQALARSLGKCLYRAQIGNLVNKYLGETEKNLDELLSRAEELDVLLLIDEADALLAPRTGVRNSNDRYANLETNFLLQRFESFSGILLMTTNAGAADRIDKAFARRMDVVVDFTAPDAHTRWSLWQIHLPATAQVDPVFLDEIAARCQFTGAQIRNISLHATVLALDAGAALSGAHLESAIAREYRKAGAMCPLRARAREEALAHGR